MSSTKQITSPAKIYAKIDELGSLSEQITSVKNKLAETLLSMNLLFSEDCEECGIAKDNVLNARKAFNEIEKDVDPLIDAVREMQKKLHPDKSSLNKDYYGKTHTGMHIVSE